MRERQINVMIVEETEEIEEYRRLIGAHPVLRLVAESSEEEEALALLKEVPVDALILDLELQNGSGILLLQKLQNMNIQKPFIEVVTNVISRQAYEPVRKIGADYICSKSSINYSFDIPLSILEICMSCGKSRKQPTVRKLYQQRIHIALKEIGFSEEMEGTAYLEEGILYMAMAGSTRVSTTKDLYPYIADKFKVNSYIVERSIRGVIEKVWAEQDVQKLQKMYDESWDMETGRPANTKFIKKIAGKVTV